MDAQGGNSHRTAFRESVTDTRRYQQIRLPRHDATVSGCIKCRINPAAAAVVAGIHAALRK
eukprot:8527115-Prorocentrum_lima.AAC.1